MFSIIQEWLTGILQATKARPISEHDSRSHGDPQLTLPRSRAPSNPGTSSQDHDNVNTDDNIPPVSVSQDVNPSADPSDENKQ